MRAALRLVAAVLICLVPSAAAGEGIDAGAMRLPVKIEDLAATLGLHRTNAADLVTDIVRLAYATPNGTKDGEREARAALLAALATPARNGDRIPALLPPNLWRERILRTKVADDQLARAIFSNRTAALVYHGLLALDGPTRAWVAQHPQVLDEFARHPGVTAAFARSIRITEGVLVLRRDHGLAWMHIVGADPSDPVRFVCALIRSRGGRAAFLYDVIAHLDGPHQRFALGEGPVVQERTRRLLTLMTGSSLTWKIDERPFYRSDVDVPLVLRLVDVREDGTPVGPATRGLWSRVLGGPDSGSNDTIDGTWLAERILTASPAARRAKLDTFLFAQRVWPDGNSDQGADLPAALIPRGDYPLLMSVLEQNGIVSPKTYAAAADAALAASRDADTLTMLQAGLAIVDGARRAATLTRASAASLATSLIATTNGASAKPALAEWYSRSLLTALREALVAKAPMSAEETVLRGLSGLTRDDVPVVAWEGRDYRVDLAASELRRMTRTRTVAAAPTLDRALERAAEKDFEPLVESIASLAYVAGLPALDSETQLDPEVWRRHRFGGDPPSGAFTNAWRLASEVFGGGHWHLVGSLLRLDIALAPLSLRRLDSSSVPPRSLMSTTDRRNMAQAVALVTRGALTDDDLNTIASALDRGRKRLVALKTGTEALETVGRDARLSEWRIAAIEWLMATDRDRVDRGFSVVEVFRLGSSPNLSPRVGGPAVALDGCLCLRMPLESWEEYAGRPAVGLLATQAADVMLRIAEILRSRSLPAALTRDVASFAIQDVLDRARPAYSDDWLSVTYTARDLADDLFDDYIAALAASGPLLPVSRNADRQ